MIRDKIYGLISIGLRSSNPKGIEAGWSSDVYTTVGSWVSPQLAGDRGDRGDHRGRRGRGGRDEAAEQTQRDCGGSSGDQLNVWIKALKEDMKKKKHPSIIEF